MSGASIRVLRLLEDISCGSLTVEQREIGG